MKISCTLSISYKMKYDSAVYSISKILCKNYLNVHNYIEQNSMEEAMQCNNNMINETYKWLLYIYCATLNFLV